MELHPATPTDIPSIMAIQFSAFEGDPYQEALFPGDYYSAAVRSEAIARTEKHWSADPSAFWQICKAPTQETIAFALWNIYDKPRPESEWKVPPQVDWCTGRAKEVVTNFLMMNCRLRWRIWEGRPYMLLNLLCVEQGWQRKGAGTLLVQWGMRKADELGLAIHLEASPAGFPLYSKLGFRQVDVEYVRAEEWDGDHDREFIAMVREPKGKEEKSMVEE